MTVFAAAVKTEFPTKTKYVPDAPGKTVDAPSPFKTDKFTVLVPSAAMVVKQGQKLFSSAESVCETGTSSWAMNVSNCVAPVAVGVFKTNVHEMPCPGARGEEMVQLSEPATGVQLTPATGDIELKDTPVGKKITCCELAALEIDPTFTTVTVNVNDAVPPTIGDPPSDTNVARSTCGSGEVVVTDVVVAREVVVPPDTNIEFVSRAKLSVFTDSGFNKLTTVAEFTSTDDVIDAFTVYGIENVTLAPTGNNTLKTHDKDCENTVHDAAPGGVVLICPIVNALPGSHVSVSTTVLASAGRVPTLLTVTEYVPEPPGETVGTPSVFVMPRFTEGVL